MTGNPFVPKMTEVQRQEAMRRYKGGEFLKSATHIARAGRPKRLAGAPAGVKSAEQGTMRGTAARPLKEIEG
jgi:hypothetical protein